jgi:hypothetical protein
VAAELGRENIWGVGRGREGGRCWEVLEPGGLCLSGLVGDVGTRKKRKKLGTDGRTDALGGRCGVFRFLKIEQYSDCVVGFRSGAGWLSLLQRLKLGGVW